MPLVSRDLQLSHATLNYLLAAYIGQDIYFSVLKQFGANVLTEEYLEPIRQALGKIRPILEDFTKNMPFVSSSWQSPETFEAESALSMLKYAKGELSQAVAKMESALATPDLSADRESVALLIAGFARAANSRFSHWEGMSFYADHFGIEDLKITSANELKDSGEMVAFSHVLYDRFADPENVDPQSYEQLRIDSALTPMMLRAQVHESNVLLNMFVEKPRFEQYDFLPNEIPHWNRYNISAQDAGYWRAFLFTPEECMQWTQAEIRSPLSAALWRKFEFTPHTAYDWIRMGAPPKASRIWLNAGYDPRQASAFVEQGITDPSMASKRAKITDADLDKEYETFEPKDESEDEF